MQVCALCSALLCGRVASWATVPLAPSARSSSATALTGVRLAKLLGPRPIPQTWSLAEADLSRFRELCHTEALRVGVPVLATSGRQNAVKRRDGGTGRRSGLKIRRPQRRGGSTPPPGTKYKLFNRYGLVSNCCSLRRLVSPPRRLYLTPSVQFQYSDAAKRCTGERWLPS